jgi:hypothetical protein
MQGMGRAGFEPASLAFQASARTNSAIPPEFFLCIEQLLEQEFHYDQSVLFDDN